MGEKWNYVRYFLSLMLEEVPEEISLKFKNLFPAENRYLTLGEKAAIYAFATEELGHYVLNKSSIGDLLWEIDGLSS